ncbi:hypothetical protein AVEN_97972-1 [Araneus ventricosus]|uniref:Uncharacterized protein n=1 Tax=Araneus ventricosus TaxID=182803 RepID=A0A4Y2PYP5_ARAVE|nr:hypothetical protein AVEN_97972-1 [Araneus ventricosus]
MRPLQAKWRGSTPHRSNFQPVHLGGPFMEAPCKPHYRSLRFRRANAPTPLTGFKTIPARPSHFRERVSLSLSTVVLQFYERSKWITDIE